MLVSKVSKSQEKIPFDFVFQTNGKKYTFTSLGTNEKDALNNLLTELSEVVSDINSELNVVSDESQKVYGLEGEDSTPIPEVKKPEINNSGIKFNAYDPVEAHTPSSVRNRPKFTERVD